MKHRNEDQHGERARHPGQHAARPPHYAGNADDDALYDGLPSVTNREWGRDRASDATSYGYRGQGGYGDFTTGHQGGYGESQGAHAQSGHGRGGMQTTGRSQQDDRVSRGPLASGHRGRGPQGYQRSDERIVDDVVGRLTDDEHIDASEILVMVENGAVTLTGNVPDRQMKHRAEDLVADAIGVREVHNRIRVDDGSASAGRPGEAIRSGRDQLGSGFSSSGRPDPVYDNPTEDSNWPSQ
jgi:osmotically-inducible protein OsmY